MRMETTPPQSQNTKIRGGHDMLAGPPTFDDLLIAVGKTRNREAFIQLFDYFAPRVKSFLMKSGLSPDQADELAQETLLTVWHRADAYDPARAAASTWIFTIARNKRIDWLRKTKHPEPEEFDPLLVPANDTLPDENVWQGEHSRILAAAMADLPEEQSALLHKAYFEDKTHDDIAKETGLPLGTVKSRIRLAMERLRHRLKDMKP